MWASLGYLGFLLKWWLDFKSDLSEESPVEVTWPLRSYSVISAVVSSLPIFEEKWHRAHFFSMERVSKSYWRRICGMGGNVVVVVFVKYTMSHRTCALWDPLGQRVGIDFYWALRNGHEQCLCYLYHLWECILHTVSSVLCHEYLSRKIKKAEAAYLKDQLL